MAKRVRAALYLDFDNIFSGLLAVDVRGAVAVAQSNSEWVDRLAVRFELDGPRVFLVRRCYMNPTGSVADPRNDELRFHFARFRPYFTRAGFEVIDCPSLTNRHKNAADIRIALDVVDAIDAPTRYDEFVIASSDADFTPLLQRLRAHDRRTTVLSTQNVAIAYEAMADQHLNEQHVLELLSDEDAEDAEDGRAAARPAPKPDLASDERAAKEGFARFRGLVLREYRTAGAPLNLARLAMTTREALGADVDRTNWFGNRTFGRALAALELPNSRITQHFLWDETRHAEPPEAGAAASTGSEEHEAPGVPGEAAATPPFELPDTVARCCTVANLPRLAQAVWPLVFDVLAEYAATHEFNLTESSKWARDALAARGVDVGRSAFAFVVRGSMYGGCPLHRQPPPTAAEISSAFLTNVVNQAGTADLHLDDGELDELTTWLGAARHHDGNAGGPMVWPAPPPGP